MRIKFELFSRPEAFNALALRLWKQTNLGTMATWRLNSMNLEILVQSNPPFCLCILRAQDGICKQPQSPKLFCLNSTDSISPGEYLVCWVCSLDNSPAGQVLLALCPWFILTAGRFSLLVKRKVTFQFPLRRDLSFSMPRRLRVTPRRDRGGRAPPHKFQFSSFIPEGYANSVPDQLRQILDAWEEEMVGTHPATQRTRELLRSYWAIKNLHAQMIMRLPGVMGHAGSSPMHSSSSHSSSSSNSPHGSQHGSEPPNQSGHQCTDEQQHNQEEEPETIPPRKQVARKDQPSTSSFIKHSGLPTKTAPSSSSSESSYGCPIIEEIPPGGPPGVQGKLS